MSVKTCLAKFDLKEDFQDSISETRLLYGIELYDEISTCLSNVKCVATINKFIYIL